MDWKLFGTVFATVFVAELGDKTQLATLLLASDASVSRTTVFLAAAAALVLAAALGVAAGAALGQLLSPRVLNRVAGAAFVGLGLWMLLRGPA